MQLRMMMIARKTAFSFSILNRIGGDATQAVSQHRNFVYLPFSILNRIGGDAT